jgi:hypothetical protein
MTDLPNGLLGKAYAPTFGVAVAVICAIAIILLS